MVTLCLRQISIYGLKNHKFLQFIENVNISQISKAILGLSGQNVFYHVKGQNFEFEKLTVPKSRMSGKIILELKSVERVSVRSAQEQVQT